MTNNGTTAQKKDRNNICDGIVVGCSPMETDKVYEV
jgi:hypothetical protein